MQKNVGKTSNNRQTLAFFRTMSLSSACAHFRRFGALYAMTKDLLYDNFDPIRQKLFGFQFSIAEETIKKLSDRNRENQKLRVMARII